MHGAADCGRYTTGSKDLTAGECPPATSLVEIAKQYPDIPLLQCPLRRSHADITNSRECESGRLRGEVGSPKSYWPQPARLHSARLAAQPVTSNNRSGSHGRPWRPRWPEGTPRGVPEANGNARQTLRTQWFRRQGRRK